MMRLARSGSASVERLIARPYWLLRHAGSPPRLPPEGVDSVSHFREGRQARRRSAPTPCTGTVRQAKPIYPSETVA